MQYIVQDLQQIPVVANLFVNEVIRSGKEIKHRKFAFVGEMGVGKTTLILAILRQMGIKDVSGSPTYSLVNEYVSEKFGKVYHFDMYRIESETEAYDIGMEEMIYDEKALCFIEWPERVKNILSNEFVWVNLDRNDKGFRTINVRI